MKDLNHITQHAEDIAEESKPSGDAETVKSRACHICAAIFMHYNYDEIEDERLLSQAWIVGELLSNIK